MLAPASSPLAPPRGVDLWSVPLDGTVAREARLIARCSARERDRAAGMPVDRRRRRFLVGRGIVRSILCAYTGIRSGAIELAAGRHGKPFLDWEGAPAFSVSHSRDLVVVAVTAGMDVGVDVEWIDRALDVMAIARRFLSLEEAADLARSCPQDRTTAFLRLWTRKEARMKLTGRGFADGTDVCAATLVDIMPAPGYVGALAYDAPPAPLHIPNHVVAGL